MLWVDGCEPSQPVSVIHVHGTADENLPIAGGVGPRSLAGVAFPPPHDGIAEIAAHDDCDRPIETTVGDITTAASTPCDAGTATAFITIAGANHAWPGGTPVVRPASGDGYPDYDATAEIVAFLLSVLLSFVWVSAPYKRQENPEIVWLVVAMKPPATQFQEALNFGTPRSHRGCWDTDVTVAPSMPDILLNAGQGALTNTAVGWS